MLRGDCEKKKSSLRNLKWKENEQKWIFLYDKALESLHNNIKM